MMNGTTIETKLAKLNKQISDEHARFKAASAPAVVSLLSEYRLTLVDLQTPVNLPKAKPPKPAKPVKVTTAKTAKKRKAPFKGPHSPRYGDPDSGATRTGFGRASAWIAGIPDRAPYLINGGRTDGRFYGA